MSIEDQVVLITGASSGIGKATACHFAKQGAKLILAARRLHKIDELAAQLKDQYGVDILTLALDVQDNMAINAALSSLPDAFKAITILVNNAGLALESTKIQDGNVAHWDTMIQTNVSGLLYMTRAVLPGMIERDQGHIVNIGSVAGHDCYTAGNIYCGTKHMVRALSKSLRIDLSGTHIRVTEIDPGAVHTHFSEVRWRSKEKSDQFYADFEPLVADDIADAVIYATTRPSHVNIAEMVIYPVAQASVNHLSRHGKPAVGGGAFDES